MSGLFLALNVVGGWVIASEEARPDVEGSVEGTDNLKHLMDRLDLTPVADLKGMIPLYLMDRFAPCQELSQRN